MAVPDEIRSALEPYFDSLFYVEENPDVVASEIDPLEHFFYTGWLEGRNPSSEFNVDYYLSVNTDVAEAGINPLLHYAWKGKKEGRKIRRRLDVQRRQIERARAPSIQAADWSEAANHSDPIEGERLSELLFCSRLPLIVSFSHDDYAAHTGGIQNLIAEEVREFGRNGWRYLHASPAAPLPMLASAISPKNFKFILRLDGTLIGVATAETLGLILTRLRESGLKLDAVVHHLMGHCPETITAMLAEAGISRPVVWIHDFFTLCPGYNLLRNDTVYCHAPPIDSHSCMICCYATDRQVQIPRIRAFFAATVPIVLAPSRVALDIWSKRSDLPTSSRAVQPLAKLVFAPKRAGVRKKQSAITVGHIGMKTYNKGWHVFDMLASRFGDDRRYNFVQIGGGMELVSAPRRIRSVPATTTPTNPSGMIMAIAEEGVDVALIWPTWPETFSYVVHEALATGAFVVTNPHAGNISSVVAASSPQQGTIVKDEAELVNLFEGERLCELLAAANPRRGALIRSGGTARWFASEATAAEAHLIPAR
jgi:hypothetical protein